MRIAIMSDMHIDLNSIELKRNLVPELNEILKTKEPDLILIAGDLTNYANDSIKVINDIEKSTNVKVLFIPGNHDIWTTKKESMIGLDSWYHYTHLAKQESSLIDKPYHINDEYVIVGDMGWYDYTFAPENIPYYTMKSRKRKLWNDAKYALWGMEDKDLTNLMMDKFKKVLEENKHKKVIFMNHFIPYKEFVTYSLHNNEWNLTNGFLGTSNLGWLIDQYPNIEYVIFGHIHKRYGQVTFGGKTIVCNPLGYAGEWETGEFKKEMEKAITVIEI